MQTISILNESGVGWCWGAGLVKSSVRDSFEVNWIWGSPLRIWILTTISTLIHHQPQNLSGHREYFFYFYPQISCISLAHVVMDVKMRTEGRLIGVYYILYKKMDWRESESISINNHERHLHITYWFIIYKHHHPLSSSF